MELTELTRQVMNSLTPVMPYLNSAGTAIATKIGEDVYQRGKKLYEAMCTRFAHEPDDKASKALQAFVSDPDLGSVVEVKLQRLLQSDPAFADTLLQLVQAGPQMVIEASEQAIVRQNRMENAQSHGHQGIKASGEAQVIDNQMNITRE